MTALGKNLLQRYEYLRLKNKNGMLVTKRWFEEFLFLCATLKKRPSA